MSENKSITQLAYDYNKKLIDEKFSKRFVYHNQRHIDRVIKNSLVIGKASDLTDTELEILELAAIFHDSGFSFKYFDNESIGTEIAETFLKENNYPKENIEAIKNCILATKLPQSPKTLTEEVLCDADLSNLGKKYFFEVTELIRQELEYVTRKKVEQLDWRLITQVFLQTHKFHTQYAQENFAERKKINMEKLNIMINEIENIEDSPKNDNQETPQKDKKNSKLKKQIIKEMNAEKELKKLKKQFMSVPPSRGIETMFRNNLRGHLELSGLADNKANIMLSINAIVISIVIASLLPQFDIHPELIYPTVLLLVVCVVTIIFATISTRPKVTEGTFSKKDIENKSANLLFFGNFHNMKLEDFEWGMQEMMKDKEFLYGSMIRDFYYLGKVLNKKYKYLRICYTVFMYGLVLSVISFLIAFLAGK